MAVVARQVQRDIIGAVDCHANGVAALNRLLAASTSVESLHATDGCVLALSRHFILVIHDLFEGVLVIVILIRWCGGLHPPKKRQAILWRLACSLHVHCVSLTRRL